MLQTPARVPVGLAVLPAPCHTSMVLMGAEGRRDWVLPAGTVDPKSFSSWETGNRQLQEKMVYTAPCSLRTASFTVSSDPRTTLTLQNYVFLPGLSRVQGQPSFLCCRFKM